MPFHKINVWLIPVKAEKVKQFEVPRVLFVLLIFFLFLFVLPLTGIVLDYQSMKSKNCKLIHLERENRGQKKLFIHMAERIILMAKQLDQTEISDSNDNIIVKMGRSRDKALFQEDIALDPNDAHSINSASRAYRELVLQMYNTLDHLNDVIHSQAFGGLREDLSPADTNSNDKDASDLVNRRAKKVNKNIIKKKIREIAAELGLDPNLAIGMAKVESGFHPKLVSPKGAVGVFQVMPKTAWHYFKVNRESLFDPDTNIWVGLSWMKSLLERFDYDLELSLAAYNAGVSRVVKAGHQIPAIKETQAYVRKVKKIMRGGAS